jgi:pyrroline-5-carboxylate reductase
MPDILRRIAIIGAGAVGQALGRGLIAAGIYAPENIIAADIDKAKLGAFQEYSGVSAAGTVEAASRSAVVVIAVKPNAVPALLDEICDYVKPEQLVISVAAGVTTETIESHLTERVPVIRAMPNLPCAVREGATAICRGRNAENQHVERATSIFGSVGKVIEVPENLMSVVTGLSGSGPAFVCVAIEAMADAGVAEGLSRQQALTLAAQTVLGAAKLVLETNKHPAELKDMVANPKGTTIEGIKALERAGFRAALIDAIEVATLTSEMISQQAEQEKRRG